MCFYLSSTSLKKLSIENNQLSLFQVEAVINGKAVIGEQKDIQEVKNAYKAYEEIDNINPYIKCFILSSIILFAEFQILLFVQIQNIINLHIYQQL